MTICKIDPSDVVSAFLTQLNSIAGQEVRDMLTVSQLHAVQHLVALTANNLIMGAQVEYAYVVAADCDDPTLPGSENVHLVAHDHTEAVELFSNLCNGAATDLATGEVADFTKAHDRIVEQLTSDDWLGGRLAVSGGGVTVSIERHEVRS